MDKKLVRQTILYCISAVLAFSALFLISFRSRSETAIRTEPQVVIFGDSVFGLIRDETGVSAQLQSLTGKEIYNAALGGTNAARLEDDRRLGYGKGSLSLAGLTKAVWAQDFGPQQSVRVRESNTEYFEDVIKWLSTVDFSKVETVLIQQGINDYHAGIPIENPDAPYDAYTFLGALRSSVHALKKANPDIRIILMTPTYSWYLTAGLTCEEFDQGGGILAEYVEAEIRTAEELGVEILDVYHGFYPHETWEDWSIYTFDGVHPNEAGRELLAERIAEILCGDRAD